ncbi:MAG: RHS repeat-associated core domain-containing protein [Acidobacteriota bacterium]
MLCELKSCLRHLIRSRYYDPRTGIFLSEDKARSRSLYLYVRNSPLNLTDPFGLVEQSQTQASSCEVNIRPPGKKCNGMQVYGCTICYKEDFACEITNLAEGIRPCVLEHEQTHVDWHRQHQPGWCCGKKDGTMILVTREQSDETECEAYQASKDCLHDLKSPGYWQKIRKHETEVDKKIQRHCRGGTQTQ